MTIQWNKDDLFYVCTMIEYVSRKTNNKSKDVVVRISDKALAHQLKVAGINHWTRIPDIDIRSCLFISERC